MDDAWKKASVAADDFETVRRHEIALSEVEKLSGSKLVYNGEDERIRKGTLHVVDISVYRTHDPAELEYLYSITVNVDGVELRYNSIESFERNWTSLCGYFKPVKVHLMFKANCEELSIDVAALDIMKLKTAYESRSTVCVRTITGDEKTKYLSEFWFDTNDLLTMQVMLDKC